MFTKVKSYGVGIVEWPHTHYTLFVTITIPTPRKYRATVCVPLLRNFCFTVFRNRSNTFDSSEFVRKSENIYNLGKPPSTNTCTRAEGRTAAKLIRENQTKRKPPVSPGQFLRDDPCTTHSPESQPPIQRTSQSVPRPQIQKPLD